MTKEIQLTRGYVALVDDADYEVWGHIKWRAHIQSHTVYAIRDKRMAGKRTTTYLHREIMGIADRPNLEVDHINHNGLDCRRENMRVAERNAVGRNCANTQSHKDSTSRYVGVSWDSAYQKWRAMISVGPQGLIKWYNLGRFDSEEEAARAYDVAACDIRGKYANCNLGPPGYI